MLSLPLRAEELWPSIHHRHVISEDFVTATITSTAYAEHNYHAHSCSMPITKSNDPLHWVRAVPSRYISADDVENPFGLLRDIGRSGTYAIGMLLPTAWVLHS